jgi:hypothetical protein
LIGYHGCDRQIGEAVLAGRKKLHPSLNEYDWLGSGIYFWVGSPARGLHWARELAKRESSAVRDPFVLGAFIYPQHCLNLTDYGALPEVREAYEYVAKAAAKAGRPLPENTVPRGGILMRRALDCAVINVAHRVRVKEKDPKFDTVYGVFEEGGEIYPGAAFKSKTHVQIAVRNLDCIVGYFRVPEIRKLIELDVAA